MYSRIIIIIIMSSSGATGWDQCNRRRLRAQPQLKVMPADARHKIIGTEQGRPGWRKETGVTLLDSHNGSLYSSPHPSAEEFRQAQTGWGGNQACGPGINPAIHKWSVSHRERGQEDGPHAPPRGWGRASV